MKNKFLYIFTYCFLSAFLLSSGYLALAEVKEDNNGATSDIIASVEDISEVEETNKDAELLALIAVAEAEGEGDFGKILVMDTVLNRVDSPNFPNTIEDVIYQPYHFSSVWNGRIDRSYPTDYDISLAKKELESRTNDDVIFFQTTCYSKYGIPLFQVGNHYFSSEN